MYNVLVVYLCDNNVLIFQSLFIKLLLLISFVCFLVNMHRPRLRPDGSTGSDYINASFVDVSAGILC